VEEMEGDSNKKREKLKEKTDKKIPYGMLLPVPTYKLENLLLYNPHLVKAS
jgi:hypothetical protein